MRKMTTLFVTIGVIGGLTFVAAPAGAGVDDRVVAKTSRFCKAVKNFEVPDVSDDPDAREQAAATAKELRRIGRKAKGKTKKATLKLAGFFKQLADGDSAAEVLGSGYASAAATFAGATLKCLVRDTKLPDVSLPDVSLPDISLPDITLPGR
ncbi:MAG TPA: hypothetical protein VFW06_09590 [Acidimicrobiia bacterium]|nr:hypothetical protein [Acidimicrobiia bacterium]